MGKQGVCPGCSRHCRMDDVRCKYGRKYFEKKRKGHAKADDEDVGENKKLRKWEKHVQRGGLIWRFLWVASLSKRALRKKQIAEERLLTALTEAEQEQLHRLLKKLVDSVMGNDSHA